MAFKEPTGLGQTRTSGHSTPTSTGSSGGNTFTIPLTEALSASIVTRIMDGLSRGVVRSPHVVALVLGTKSNLVVTRPPDVHTWDGDHIHMHKDLLDTWFFINDDSTPEEGVFTSAATFTEDNSALDPARERYCTTEGEGDDQVYTPTTMVGRGIDDDTAHQSDLLLPCVKISYLRAHGGAAFAHIGKLDARQGKTLRLFTMLRGSFSLIRQPVVMLFQSSDS